MPSSLDRTFERCLITTGALATVHHFLFCTIFREVSPARTYETLDRANVHPDVQKRRHSVTLSCTSLAALCRRRLIACCE